MMGALNVNLYAMRARLGVGGGVGRGEMMQKGGFCEVSPCGRGAGPANITPPIVETREIYISRLHSHYSLRQLDRTENRYENAINTPKK